MSEAVKNFISFLKARGSVHVTDSPYLPFVAEMVCNDLWLGYADEVNGDICFDPLFVYRPDGSIAYQNDLMGVRQELTEEDEIAYAHEFASTVWDRHCWLRAEGVQHTTPKVFENQKRNEE